MLSAAACVTAGGHIGPPLRSGTANGAPPHPTLSLGGERENNGMTIIAWVRSTHPTCLFQHGKGDSPLFAKARKGYSPLCRRYFRGLWTMRGL
jgi:hypothetical protein